MLSRNGILKAMDAGDITIDPFDSRHLGPNSYDLTLGDKIAFYVLTGEGVDYPTTTYGQVAPDLTPDMFGHMAALEPDSPVTKHIVQRPLMNLAGRPPILQREISKDGIVLYPGNVYPAQVNEKIKELTGSAPTVFRPPFGDYNDLVINTVREQNMHCIQWDVDSLDWKDPTPDDMVKRIKTKISTF